MNQQQKNVSFESKSKKFGTIEITAKLPIKNDPHSFQKTEKEHQQLLESNKQLETLAHFYSSQSELFEKDKFMLSIEIARLSKIIEDQEYKKQANPRISIESNSEKTGFSAYFSKKEEIIPRKQVLKNLYKGDEQEKFIWGNPLLENYSSFGQNSAYNFQLIEPISKNFSLQLEAQISQLAECKEKGRFQELKIKELEGHLQKSEGESKKFREAANQLKIQLEDQKRSFFVLKSQYSEIKGNSENQMNEILNRLKNKKDKIARLKTQIEEKEKFLNETQQNFSAIRKKLLMTKEKLAEELEQAKISIFELKTKQSEEIKIARDASENAKKEWEAKIEYLELKLADLSKENELNSLNYQSQFSDYQKRAEEKMNKQLKIISFAKKLRRKIEELNSLDINSEKSFKRRFSNAKEKLQLLSEKIFESKIEQEKNHKILLASYNRRKGLEQKLADFHEQMKFLMEANRKQILKAENKNQSDLKELKVLFDDFQKQSKQEKLANSEKMNHELQNLRQQIKQKEEQIERNEFILKRALSESAIKLSQALQERANAITHYEEEIQKLSLELSNLKQGQSGEIQLLKKQHFETLEALKKTLQNDYSKIQNVVKQKDAEIEELKSIVYDKKASAKF